MSDMTGGPTLEDIILNRSEPKLNKLKVTLAGLSLGMMFVVIVMLINSVETPEPKRYMEPTYTPTSKRFEIVHGEKLYNVDSYTITHNEKCIEFNKTTLCGTFAITEK